MSKEVGAGGRSDIFLDSDITKCFQAKVHLWRLKIVQDYSEAQNQEISNPNEAQQKT